MFVSTTRGADRLVKQIEGEGLGAVAIHGRISQNKRERALAAFRRGDTPVLVATNVAARGIHVDSVDVVVHYDPPEDAKVYEHRSGRTARAGDRGLVVTLALPEHERVYHPPDPGAGGRPGPRRDAPRRRAAGGSRRLGTAGVDRRAYLRALRHEAPARRCSAAGAGADGAPERDRPGRPAATTASPAGAARPARRGA